MDQDRVTEFLEQAMSVVAMTLDRNRSELGNVGLRPELERAGSNQSAEVSIYFYRQHDVVDAIEFVLTKDGSPTATLLEVESWLGEAVMDVIRRLQPKPRTL